MLFLLKILIICFFLNSTALAAKSKYFEEGKILFDKREFEKSQIFPRGGGSNLFLIFGGFRQNRDQIVFGLRSNFFVEKLGELRSVTGSCEGGGSC